MIRGIALLCSILVPAVAAAEDWSLKIEGGSEYDSNPHRLEVPEEDSDLVDAAALLRFGARLRGELKTAPRRVVRYNMFLGTKQFLEQPAETEDVVIATGNVRYDIGVASRRTVVRLATSFYDAIGDDDDTVGRNFRSFDGQVALVFVGSDQHRVTAHAGFRTFGYKPNEQFDWSGDHYGLRYNTSLWQGDSEGDADASSIDIAASYRLERRNYSGVAFANSCGDDDPIVPDCFYPTAMDRVDLYHAAAAEVRYTGNRIYSGRYEVQVNDSNSVGQALVRHRIEASVTTELLADIFLTATGTVQYNVFLDPLLLARDVNAQSFVSIDDENRNGLVLHATRELGSRWSAEGRYGLFSNEFATQELRFRRQTGYLGLTYEYGE